jgi:hypothetical protein
MRGYRFEFCWFILLVLMLLFTPSPSAQSLSWTDFAWDCDSIMGWCIGIGEDFLESRLF